jgi:GAF domain-containing protein
LRREVRDVKELKRRIAFPRLKSKISVRRMSAPIPKNESRRLKVLWQYDVLDTVPEEVFDDLTDLAAHICNSPIALISLVDEDRQWFKSRSGISITETSRDISFCAHAILRDGLFIIPDTTKDARFKDNPLVTGKQKIRFYAGAPLITPDGHALGTLCVMDHHPRTLDEDQKEALRVLAHHVVSQLELRRHARELSTARKSSGQQRTELARANAEIARLRAQLQRYERRSSPRAVRNAGSAAR